MRNDRPAGALDEPPHLVVIAVRDELAALIEPPQGLGRDFEQIRLGLEQRRQQIEIPALGLQRDADEDHETGPASW